MSSKKIYVFKIKIRMDNITKPNMKMSRGLLLGLKNLSDNTYAIFLICSKLFLYIAIPRLIEYVFFSSSSPVFFNWLRLVPHNKVVSSNPNVEGTAIVFGENLSFF